MTTVGGKVIDPKHIDVVGISTDGTLDVSGTTLLIRTTRTPIKAGVERIADDVVFVCVTTEV